MRLDTLITSAATAGRPLDRRQTTSNTTTDLLIPPNCYGPCDNAGIQAENVGLRCSMLCPANSPFSVAYANCGSCILAYKTTPINQPADALIASLAVFVNYCSVCQNNAEATLAYLTSVAAWCASYTYIHNSVPGNCSTGRSGPSSPISSPASITTSSSSTGNLSIYGSATPSPTGMSFGHTPTASPIQAARSHTDTAAIAGGVAGGVGGLVAVIVVFLWFFLRRRRKRRATQQSQPATEEHGKAQLHSDDIKPDRKELEGTKASRDMLEKKPTDISELPANEEVANENRLKEMPSNEPPGQELETTENEMASLDRMARMTDSTTLGSGNTRSEGPPAS